MSKINKILIALLLIFAFLPNLQADEEIDPSVECFEKQPVVDCCLPVVDYCLKESSLYYVKTGLIFFPTDSYLACLGIGARLQKGYYGLDLSANIGTLVFVNYASLKAMFLYHPFPHHNNQLYIGIGPDVRYYINVIPLGGSFGGVTCKYGNVAVEAVIGYEIRLAKYLKTFIQLELSQPLVGFGRLRHYNTYKPGIALIFGLGF